MVFVHAQNLSGSANMTQTIKLRKLSLYSPFRALNWLSDLGKKTVLNIEKNDVY